MNTSWPLPAATSVPATAWILSTGIRSTTTWVSCCFPHCAAMPSNHGSNPGTKCAHFAILSFFCAALARSGKRKNGPLAAVAAVSLRKFLRENLECINHYIAAFYSLLSLGIFHRAGLLRRKTLGEAAASPRAKSTDQQRKAANR